MHPKARFALYALAIAAAIYAYIGLNNAPDAAPGTASQAATTAALGLPALTSASGSNSAAVKRDLFNVAQPPPPEPPPVVAAVEPAPAPAPPPPDRLSQLKVIGVVSRGARLAILIELGDEVETVEAGQQFGTDEALKVDGIEDNRVLVTDRLAGITRTFTLSEE